jgi:hypothetical protein
VDAGYRHYRKRANRRSEIFAPECPAKVRDLRLAKIIVGAVVKINPDISRDAPRPVTSRQAIAYNRFWEGLQ